jgi:hypothetical protein
MTARKTAGVVPDGAFTDISIGGFRIPVGSSSVSDFIITPSYPGTVTVAVLDTVGFTMTASSVQVVFDYW